MKWSISVVGASAELLRRSRHFCETAEQTDGCVHLSTSQVALHSQLEARDHQEARLRCTSVSGALIDRPLLEFLNPSGQRTTVTDKTGVTPPEIAPPGRIQEDRKSRRGTRDAILGIRIIQAHQGNISYPRQGTFNLRVFCVNAYSRLIQPRRSPSTAWKHMIIHTARDGNS